MLGVGRVIDGSVDCWWLPQAKGDVRVEMKLKGEDQVRTGKRKLMECALSRRDKQASLEVQTASEIVRETSAGKTDS